MDAIAWTVQGKWVRMRLIDADVAVNVMANRLFEFLTASFHCVTSSYSRMCSEICNRVAQYEIDNIPTVYDIDEITERLETDPSVKSYGSGNSDNYLIPVEIAIEIVQNCIEK